MLPADSDRGCQRQSLEMSQVLGNLQSPQLVHFSTIPSVEETEITGHMVARLHVSVDVERSSPYTPSDIDLFVTLRHFDSSGDDILYTGAVGDPVPVTKGRLRIWPSQN